MRDEKIIAAKEPVQCHFEANKNYAWCSCGHSESQPFCNGAHAKTSLTPLMVKVDTARSVWLCQCKQTNNPPYCDGSHKKC